MEEKLTKAEIKAEAKAEAKKAVIIGEVASVDNKETHVGNEIVRKVTFIVGGTFKPGEKYEMIKK